jgi:uncharacterized protein (TIGR00296 family)
MTFPTVTAALCYLCFETLFSHLGGRPSHSVQSYLESQDLFIQKFPLFVTWTKGGTLRGCIGTFSPQPLLEGLKQYALTAALKDSRFKPIDFSELSSLECEVSLLHTFETCANISDWKIGVHGTIFRLGSYSATFLPHVAEEQQWTKEQTLQHLIKKSGIKKRLTESDYQKIELTRYQTANLKVTWDDYRSFQQTEFE